MNDCCIATLSAERQRLLGMTSEQVMTRAREATYTDAHCERIEKDMERQGAGPATIENHTDAVIRSALPILLAPEVAKREQAEANAQENLRYSIALQRLIEGSDGQEDRDLAPHHTTLRDTSVAKREAAERERDEAKNLAFVRFEKFTNERRIAIAAEAEAKRLRGALGPDASGRAFPDLLDQCAEALAAMGGGPMEDCLRLKASAVRAALEGS